MVDTYLDWFEPGRVRLSNTRRQGLDNGILVGTEEKRNGEPGLALDVVCSVDGRLEHTIRPHAEGVADVDNKVTCSIVNILSYFCNIR